MIFLAVFLLYLDFQVESVRVDLGEVSTCAHCGKRFQTLTAFARLPKLENEKAKIDEFDLKTNN